MATDILKQYKILVEFLGVALGPDYEIVLQDLTSDLKEPAIVAIANGHISGREIGSPLTNAALQMLRSKMYEDKDYLANYKGITESGHKLRSSTMFIKDESGEPVALLCINFDDSRYQELAKKLRTVIHPAGFGENSLEFDKSVPDDTYVNPLDPFANSITETFPMDIPSLMQKIFDDSTIDLGTSANRLNQHERKDVMVKLNDQGLFQLKGAISFVAKKFGCSTATIYRYLSEITN